ncbi:dolichol kinase isoform X3 [Agrilus planipennis]|uniref:dolichol kinase n=1 Tax=Agrilus planipennis TaxID=224129 RepID=A0A7F5R310_AGRPL|nr:dolichol kinase isoform X3 [Agrilus planipennis]
MAGFFITISHQSTATILTVILLKGLLFSLLISFFVTFGFKKSLFTIIKLFPRSFSFGEACVCAEGLIFFMVSFYINIIAHKQSQNERLGSISTTVIQIGLFGLGLICLTSYYFKGILCRTIPFYIFIILSLFILIILPLHVVLQRSPILWIINLFTADRNTVYVFFYWILCCIVATLIVRNQIEDGNKASTIVRKTFHVLAVAVYLPGLLYCCNLLYLASGVVLGIFVGLELLRILKIEPLGPILQDGFHVYSDEKDVGSIALTPIYLLVGCSLPLWIHPDPCDVVDSAGFNLLPLTSGLLTIGIGDAAASAMGKKFGKHKWPGSQKTFEGTIACILSQLIMVFIFNRIGYAAFTPVQIGRIIFGIIFCSYVEAVTDQIDNLVLPFIMYIILI